MNVKCKKSQIEKAINKFGKEIEIMRTGENDFGEPGDEIIVTTLKAYYYKGNQSININLQVVGEIKSSNQEKLMVIINENSELIEESDYFTLDGIKYAIADIHNSFDVYYDITLKRVL